MVLQSRSSLYIRHGFPNSRYIAHFECGFQFIHIPSLFLEDKSRVGMIDDKMQEYTTTYGVSYFSPDFYLVSANLRNQRSDGRMVMA